MSLPPRPTGPGPSPTERLWQFVTLVSIGSLVATFGLRGLLAGPVDGVALAVFAIQVLPLLAFVPGVVGGNARSAALLGFVAMPYFAWGVLVIIEPEGRIAGSALTLFSTTLFLGATYFARDRGKRGAATAASATDAVEETNDADETEAADRPRAAGKAEETEETKKTSRRRADD